MSGHQQPLAWRCCIVEAVVGLILTGEDIPLGASDGLTNIHLPKHLLPPKWREGSDGVE
jgi:hypothetical protein